MYKRQGFLSHADGVLRLSLAHGDEHLQSPALVRQLAHGLENALGGVPQVRFEVAPEQGETVRARAGRERDARQQAAESGFMADPDIQHLMQRHGAQLVPGSIRPHDE